MVVGEGSVSVQETGVLRREVRRSRYREGIEGHRRIGMVAIGGGTGLPSLLEGLARFARERPSLGTIDITAVVAMGDDGGSSGRLRRENGVLPPGDLRNCLVALSSTDDGQFAGLFRYRFGKGEGLRGHSLGNLLITALTSIEGDFLAGLERAQRMLHCSGRVIPSTLERVELVACLAGGERILGEHALAGHRGPRIDRLELAPMSPRAAPGVLDAITDADVIVMGPGSLYSSVIANLLVEGVGEALRESSALRILIQNLMTEPGETQGMDAASHLDAVLRHAGKVVDVLLFDEVEADWRKGDRLKRSGLQGLRPEVVAGYAAMGQRPVHVDRREILARDVIPVEAPLLAKGARVRHDPDKVAAAVIGLALRGREA